MRRSTASNSCNRALFASDTEVYLPLPDELQLAMGAAGALVNSCQEAKDAYINEGLLTRKQASALEEMRNRVPSLPSRVSESADANVTEQLSQDFCDLSVFLTFLQYSQVQHQNNSELFLKEVLDKVNTNIITLQHTIQNVLRSLNVDVTSNVDLYVIPNLLKNITSSKLRYRRDYYFMKESHSFASAINSHYDILRSKMLN